MHTFIRRFGASALFFSAIFLTVVPDLVHAGEISDNAQPQVHDIALQDGGHQRVLYLPATSGMRGAIVMFPGGAGDIGIKKDGDMEHGDNFVVRTRDLWREKGYAVVIVDAIDRQSMRGVRSTPAYAAIAKAITLHQAAKFRFYPDNALFHRYTAFELTTNGHE